MDAIKLEKANQLNREIEHLEKLLWDDTEFNINYKYKYKDGGGGGGSLTKEEGLDEVISFIKDKVSKKLNIFKEEFDKL
jgi:hypothetical protein